MRRDSTILVLLYFKETTKYTAKILGNEYKDCILLNIFQIIINVQNVSYKIYSALTLFQNTIGLLIRKDQIQIDKKKIINKREYARELALIFVINIPINILCILS